MRSTKPRPEEIKRITEKLLAINSMYAEIKAEVLGKATIKNAVVNKLDNSIVINYDDTTVERLANIEALRIKYLQSDPEIMEFVNEGIILL